MSYKIYRPKLFKIIIVNYPHYRYVNITWTYDIIMQQYPSQK